MSNEYDEIIESLKKKYPIEEQIEFSEFDLNDKLMKNIDMIIYYKSMYNKENHILERIDMLLEETIGKKYDFYRFDYDKNLTKTEIEKYYIPNDKDVIRIKKIRIKQKAKVDFFDMCVKAMEKQGWNLKTFSQNIRSGF